MRRWEIEQSIEMFEPCMCHRWMVCMLCVVRVHMHMLRDRRSHMRGKGAYAYAAREEISEEIWASAGSEYRQRESAGGSGSSSGQGLAKSG